MNDRIDCPSCKGHGVFEPFGFPCNDCEAKGYIEKKQIISCVVYMVSVLDDDFGFYQYLPDIIYDNEYEARKHVNSLGYTEKGKPIGEITRMDVVRFFMQ